MYIERDVCVCVFVCVWGACVRVCVCVGNLKFNKHKRKQTIHKSFIIPMYVCVYVHTCVMYDIYIYIYVCVYACMYVCNIYIYIYVYTFLVKSRCICFARPWISETSDVTNRSGFRNLNARIRNDMWRSHRECLFCAISA